MLPILFAAASALTAKTAAAAGIGIAAAAAMRKAKKRKELARRALEQKEDFDSEVFEAAFKEALEKACKNSKL